jgi:hypothetical protein
MRLHGATSQKAFIFKEGLGYYGLKLYKPCIQNVCPELLGQRKEAKLQWLQNYSYVNGEYLNNLRQEINRTPRIRDIFEG